MNTETTIQILAAITDEGLFERLAMAILREANPNYQSLVHTGVNVEGKTVKSPLDGICFVKGANSSHMISVHHTIAARDDLEKKWLHDPSKVKYRKGSRPTAPAGDLIKTAGVVAKERKNLPNLHATLILTTNKEPSVDLVLAVETAGRNSGLNIDIWSCSRLTHFLDNTPTGQWIRSKYLGIEQEQLSSELLYELSKKSLEIYRPPDDPNAWVPRSLDIILTNNISRDVTFIVAGSGLGKSVACYRLLTAHIESGGSGFVLSHNEVASSVSIEQAITKTLQQLHAPLSSIGPSALSFCSPERPLIIVVEDINRSGQSQLLADKLAHWSASSNDNKSKISDWHLLCPLWPEILVSLSDQVRKRMEPLIVVTGGFTQSEGSEAVLARARIDGIKLSALKAKEISHALGYDPLLIALHDQRTEADPNKIISQFVESAVSRTAREDIDFPAAEYRKALRALAGEMLTNRQIELKWNVVSRWNVLQGQTLSLLNRLAHSGDLIRIIGPSDDQKFTFRHYLVRAWILADAAADLNQRDLLTKQIIEDPYFAEIIGTILFWGDYKPSFLQCVAASNPLALFYAIRLFRQSRPMNYQFIIQAINDWLDNPSTHEPSNLHLRWEALAILEETDSADVPAFVCKFHERTISGQLARLRNGDLSGGIELCINIEPGCSAPWRDIQIEHAKLRYGRKLNDALSNLLKSQDLKNIVRVGTLRLAGHIADPTLAEAIEACWSADGERNEHLEDYLWAFSECCGADPARYLKPVCDSWAALSDQSDKHGASPRDNLAAHGVRWAFNRWPPTSALDYFIQRGSQDNLRWPITIMLHGIDHPKAVMFVVKELAAIQRRLEGTKSFSPFVDMVRNDWRRKQEESGRPMSKTSRNMLLDLWRDETNDKHLRTQAFSLWAATRASDDLNTLCAAKQTDELADKILWARLNRGDQSAIPTMINKLEVDEHGYWWQCGRHIWTPELTKALDNYLGRRNTCSKLVWGESLGSDWITSEMIMQLPTNEAEPLLLRHWTHLRFCPYFVQAALYVATTQLLEVVQAAINECPEPAKLLEHLSIHFGILMKKNSGLDRETKVLALAPYLHLLSPMDISELCRVCNNKGWFTMRQKILDKYLTPPYLHNKWDCDQAILELDKIITDNHLTRLEYVVDDFLKTGVSWTEVLATMTKWLDQRRSFNALQIVAAAIIHRGTRADLNVLSKYKDMFGTKSKQLIADTEFAVRRRSIC